VLDLFDAEQYAAFHGSAPPPGWRAATAEDVQAAAGHERPHIVFLSAPCKGFSGLLAEGLSRTDKYQALNHLTLRGVWLMLEAFQDNPPELVVFENVPRIASRGRALLDRIGALLRHYGYAVAETTHDCGELGGLAQTRKRFLFIARHRAKVPPFLYEPPKRPLRAVGDVLGRMPLPGDVERAGPMHRVPSLQWQTWVRLAFVEAGADWRSLNRLRVEDGELTDFRLIPDADWHAGVLGVRAWDDHAGTVTGNARPGTGAYSVADPRRDEGVAAFGQYGVKSWREPSQTVIGKAAVGAGGFAVADPRHGGPEKFNNVHRVIPWDRHAAAVTSSRDVAVADPRAAETMFHNAFKTVAWDDASQAITGQHPPSNGAMCVADPRTDDRRSGAIGVVGWGETTGTVAGESLPSNGTFAVSDPRPNLRREKGGDWAGAGHYGVVQWTQNSGAVSSAAGYDNGRFSVADPRLPAATDRLVAVIRSTDGTWHRPFTTLELAALQSLVDPEEQLELDGLSDADWRERIGNAVPPDAAAAIASTMGTTLLLAWSGEGFMLSAVPIWVRPIATALSVRQAEGE
jgi:site-specific DNA-cytosine methylase